MAIASGTATATSGEAFFQALVEHAARAFGTRWSCVGVLDGDTVRTRAFWDHGRADAPPYPLPGSPCEQAARQGCLRIDAEVVGAFPEDLALAEMGVEAYLGCAITDGAGRVRGVLSVLHDAAIAWPDESELILTIFAARASAELQRLEAEQSLHEREREARRLAHERTSALIEVQRSEARFRSVIENASDPVIIMTVDGVCLYASPATERAVGLPPAQLVGANLFGLLHPEDVDPARSVVADVLADADQPFTMQLRVRHRDGSWRDFVCTAHNRLGDPAIGGVVVNARDVTTEIALEQQLRQAQKMEGLGRLAGGVAHDFNNLVTVIQGYCEMITEELAIGHRHHEPLHQIQRAAERAASLTGQLLAFSRKQVLRPVVLDPIEVVAGMEPMLRRLVGEDIRIAVDFAMDVPALRADRAGLEQVLMNLVVNARDAMPRGGRLDIAVDRATLEADAVGDLPGGEFVVLTVRDTGHGMSPEVQAHIFEPFFTTREPGKGTGLGLSTVYGIVRQSGGAIACQSAPGQGACFTVYLPGSAGSPARLEGVTRVAPPGRGRVLVVEDDASVRSLVRRILHGRGYAVVEASDGPGALELLSLDARAVDVVLTDVVMPEMSGPALAQRIRVLRPELPILFMSGYPGEEVMRRGLAHRDVPVLQKPFTPHELAEAVRRLLDREPALARGA